MLFDMGSDYKSISINMAEMMFPLDIIFINSTAGVVGVMKNIAPTSDQVLFSNENLPGARFFMEVNAGEASDINIGDEVQIEGYVAPQQWLQIALIALQTVVIVIASFKAIKEVKAGG
jgi:uncharacterized membrane protein (UPF0127 family)